MSILFRVLHRAGQRHEHTVEKAVSKSVTCEGCQQDYSFIVRRVGVGTAIDWFHRDAMSGSTQSREAAEDMATKDLEAKLASEVEPTPCPHCGLYQKAMVDATRKSRGETWKFVCFGLLFISFMAALSTGILFDPTGELPLPNRRENLMFIGAALAGAACAYGVSWLVFLRANPNRQSLEARLALAKQKAYRPEEAERMRRDEEAQNQEVAAKIERKKQVDAIIAYAMLGVAILLLVGVAVWIAVHFLTR